MQRAVSGKHAADPAGSKSDAKASKDGSGHSHTHDKKEWNRKEVVLFLFSPW